MGKTVFIREPARLTVDEGVDGYRIRYLADGQEISSLREISIDGEVFKCQPEIVPVLNEKYGTDNEEAMSIYYVSWNGNRFPVHAIVDANVIMTALYTVRIR